MRARRGAAVRGEGAATYLSMPARTARRDHHGRVPAAVRGLHEPRERRASVLVYKPTLNAYNQSGFEGECGF